LNSDNTIGIDWENAKEELFGTEVYGGWADPVNVLKNFIRTQFYRPMFFNHKDFKNFTTNPDAYRCSTEKSYINHDG
jgi:hypothetical protein